MIEKLCPRCGLRFSYIKRKRVGERYYYYAVHKDKGKITRTCYLGPVGGYEYVSRLHEDLQLQLFSIVERSWVDYVRSMVESRVELALENPSMLNVVAGEVREAARIISEAASRLKLELSMPELEVELKARVKPYKSEVFKAVELEHEHEGSSTLISLTLAERLCHYGVATKEFCAVVEKLKAE